MSWQPSIYLRFGDERTRPAGELLARVPLETPQRVVDLGCGPGNSTALLAARWPDAQVTGVDSSAAMLEKAGAVLPQAEWIESDIATWAPVGEPDEAPDLIYSNAALHWLDGHAALFPRLLSFLAPGGVLAVQMPGNFSAPSHLLLREVVEETGDDRLVSRLRPDPVGTEAFYFDLLAPHAAHIDIWETTYTQVLEGDDPVLAWTRGTALVPFLDALDDEAGREAFLAAYAAKLRRAYPMRADGRTLFPFRRIFIVAST